MLLPWNFICDFSITKNMNLICFWIHLMKSGHVMGIKETILTNPPFQQRDITENTILVNPLPPVCAYLLPEPPKLRRIFYLFASKKLLLNIKYFLRSKSLILMHRVCKSLGHQLRRCNSTTISDKKVLKRI